MSEELVEGDLGLEREMRGSKSYRRVGERHVK